MVSQVTELSVKDEAAMNSSILEQTSAKTWNLDRDVVLMLIDGRWRVNRSPMLG